MRQFFVITIFAFTAFCSYGQNCGFVSTTKNKKTGIETKSGIVSSKDFYSLLILKNVNTGDSLNYTLFLNAASRVMLSDSILKSKGTFELSLKSGEKITIENANCENDPLGFGASIGFTVKTRKEILESVIDDPIQKIKVFGILETEFSLKKQKELQRILTCLINEK